MESIEEMGGFMLPRGFKEEAIRYSRARVREMKRRFPDMDRDPLCGAMKEISDNWDQIMPGVELTWHLCAMAAKSLLKARSEAESVGG